MLLVLHAAATFAMTGVIWFVQVVHYPLFGGVGADAFPTYEERHKRLTTWIVAPLMLTELGTGVALLLDPPRVAWTPWFWADLVMLGVLWASTAFVQVPLHERLGAGFDPVVHRRLVRSNWLRTLVWTARAGVVLYLLASATGA